MNQQQRKIWATTHTRGISRKKELYEIYLSFIRGQITDTLDRVEFVDPETGERTAPKQALENLAKKADQDIKEHKDIH